MLELDSAVALDFAAALDSAVALELFAVALEVSVELDDDVFASELISAPSEQTSGGHPYKESDAVVVFSQLAILDVYNRTTTRPLPQLNREGGDDSAV